MHGLVGTACFVYLDDVVVFGCNEEEHLRNLELVLERFREFNLTVNPSKCKFAQSKVLLLGYTISEHRISKNPDKIRAIVNLPIPTKVSEIRTFLGMSGYYRQLVPDYARISHPLIQLIKKGVQWQWTKDCQNSFDKLKEILTSDIVLAYPQTDKPYKLYTDASNYAVGAILVQADDSGIERVIHYLSHMLDPTQAKWSTVVKEAYAIVYALQKLRPYLWGSRFEIITDHKPLKSLFCQDIANSKIQRWAVQISEFNAPIRYKCGRDNARADMLSRAKIPEQLPILTIEWSLPLEFDKINKEEIVLQQKQVFPKLFESVSAETEYALSDDILVSVKRPSAEHATYPRVVLPPQWRKKVKNNRHEQAGHAAFQRTLYHVQQSYV